MGKILQPQVAEVEAVLQGILTINCLEAQQATIWTDSVIIQKRSSSKIVPSYLGPNFTDMLSISKSEIYNHS